ncbi:MAG: haloacid dehalogenase type II [Hyphomicrobiaceae bacterium]
MRLTDFSTLTFDCYGTLIDWESGIWSALAPLARKAKFGREAALEAFSLVETAQERETPSLRYASLLSTVHARLAHDWGIGAKAAEHEAFGASVPDWPAFSDSAAALKYLKKHYKLVILSNVDRTSFAASNKKLGVTFDAIYTAEDIGSYKPDPRNFDYLLKHLKRDLGVSKDEVLHTAQSLHHDHVPAAKAGLARAWIDRRYGKDGSGATKKVARPPRVHFHFKSMAELAEMHRHEVAR